MTKILLIEDDPLLREIIQINLQMDLNIEVLTASSGNEAIGLLKEEGRIDLIVSDYLMSDGSGLDVLQFLESGGHTIPFFFFTSTIDLDVFTDYVQFKGIVHKFNFDELIQNVSFVLGI